MSQLLSLYVDVQNRQLVRSTTSSVTAFLPDVYQGDTLGLYLEFLDTTVSPSDDIDYSEGAVIAAIGTIGTQPTAGFFTISDTAAEQTTGSIAYNASASAVQTAIQAALTTNWSGAIVSGNAGGPFTITNGSNGAKTALIGTPISLTPTSSVVIGTIQAGTASLPQIQYVQVTQNPIALQNTWTPYPAPSAVVTRLQTGSGTQNEIQQITLGNNPYAGAFVVNFGGATSNPIQWNATAASVQSTLQAMSSIGTGNVSVGGSPGAWVITFTGTKALTSQTLMTTIATGLVGPKALTGALSLNTAAIEEAIGENASITQTFAIQVTPSGGSSFTVLQEPITIFNDLIVGAPSIPTPGVSYYTTTESDARYLILSGGLIPVSEGGTGTDNVTGIVLGNGSNAFTSASAGTDYVAPGGSGASLKFPGSLSVASDKTLTASNSITLSGTDGATLDIGSGSSLVWQLKNTNFTAIAGNRYQIDTSSGPITVTMPGTANVSDYMDFADAKLSWDTGTVTFNRNGLPINGGTTNYVASVVGNHLSTFYTGSIYGWSIK